MIGEDRWLCERLRILLSATAASVTVNLLLGIGIVVLFWKTPLNDFLLGWIMVLVMLMGWRVWIWRYFHHHACNSTNAFGHYLRQLIALLSTSLLWCWAIWATFIQGDQLSIFLILFVATGLIAGASSLLFVDRLISALFYTPLLATIIFLLLEQATTLSKIMASMVFLYFLFLIFNAKRLYAIFSSDFHGRLTTEELNQKLQENQARLQLIFDHIDAGIIFYDCRYRLLDANRTFYRMLNVDKSQLIGLNMMQLKNQHIRKALRSPCEKKSEGRYEGEYVSTLSKHTFWVHLKTLPIFDDKGRVLGALALVRDLSQQRETERQSDLFAQFYTQNPHPVLRIDRRTGETVLANDAMKLLLKQWHASDHERWEAQLKQVIAKGRTWRFLFEAEKRAYHFEVIPVQEHYFNLYGRDITSEEKAKQRAYELAYYDDLTGLPRRNLFFEMIKKAIALSKRDKHHHALLFFDLDDFKRINDTLGHNIGDKLLIEVAKRIKQSIRQSDTLCRLGGDEFALLSIQLDTKISKASAQAHQTARKILKLFREPFWIDGHRIHIGLSIGVTIFRGEREPYDLLKEADTAMYQAKNHGKNAIFFFDQQLSEEMSQKAHLVERLHDAINNDRLKLYYQPQIDLATGKTVGAEALLRWHDKQLGFVSPALFIPAAEESGMIHDLGSWVLKQACKDIKGPLASLQYIAVNVSALEFARSDFAEATIHTVETMDVAYNRIELELTESLLVKEIEDATKKIEQLRTKGFSFAIDDFGTGYSSLSYLKSLPVESLKIDQTFVRDIGKDPSDERLVESIVDIAKNFDMLTIAEGVESEKQLQFVQKIGCNRVQGYYFGKPMDIEEFLQWQQKRHEHTSA